MPSDAMLGTGPQGVCMRCHKPGDTCDQAREKIQSGLMQLDGAINRPIKRFLSPSLPAWM